MLSFIDSRAENRSSRILLRTSRNVLKLTMRNCVAPPLKVGTGARFWLNWCAQVLLKPSASPAVDRPCRPLAENRAQFFFDVPSGPFYGFNRPGAKASQGIIQNWWRQGMMGSALAHYEGIKALSETDQTNDLKAITVPTLVMQGDDDQI